MMKTLTQENGSRLYETECGQRYPSVTTFLGATASHKERERLRKWMHKMDRVQGKGSANAHRENRAEEGKEIHREIELYLKGETSDLPDSPFTNKAVSMLKLFRRFQWGVELFVSHPHPQGYGGTLDLITVFDDELTVFDWTTSKQLKQKGWLGKKFLQTTAYAMAYETMTHDKPTQVGVIVLTPNRMQLFTDSPRNWEKEWRERLNRFYEEEMWQELGLDIRTG